MEALWTSCSYTFTQVQFCEWTLCLHSYFFVPVCFREGNEPGDESTVTYRELLQRVCQFANVLKSQGTTQPSDGKLTPDGNNHEVPLSDLTSSSVCLSTGVKKGDRVSIYMPMVVELVVAMLACVRIGAVHSIVVSYTILSKVLTHLP